MNILDWEYYNSHFPKLNKNDFNKMVYMCTVLTTDRLIKDVDTLNESELTRVKDCICNVINYKCELETQGNKSSVSNDGLSVSYIQKTNKQVEEELEHIFNTWLGALKKSGWICF